MITFGIIAVSLLIIIYLFYRGEGFRKQSQQSQAIVQTQNKNEKFYQSCIVNLAEAHQKTLVLKLQTQKNNSVDPSKYKIPTLLVENFANIASQVAAGRRTPKEAVEKLMASSEVCPEELDEFVVAQDNAIKRAWIGNTLNHFLVLCELLSEPKEG